MSGISVPSFALKRPAAPSKGVSGLQVHSSQAGRTPAVAISVSETSSPPELLADPLALALGWQTPDRVPFAPIRSADPKLRW